MEKNQSKAIISAICWVDRGFAAPTLKEYVPTEEEIQKHLKLSKKYLGGKDIKKTGIQEAAKEIEENLGKIDLDDEDSEDDDELGGNMPIFTSELGKLKEKEKKRNKQDEEMSNEDEEDQFEDDNNPDEFSDSDEEKEDFTIRKTDSLIVAATVEGDHSNLEVYIFDHKNSDLYVHHEIILGAYPLCLEWLYQWQGQKSNHIIVGTFLPEIEIWNLDSEDCEPTAVLGGNKNSKKDPIKKFKRSKDDIGSHTDAVMCLCLNPIQKEYLASGSEDTTVRIWDLDDLQCKATLNHHKEKVQTVKWNNKCDQTLLTAGYDRRINVIDVRDQSSCIRTKLSKSAGDIESAAWHTSLEHYFAISSESGQIFGFDSRKIETPVFTLQAHESACSQVCFSPHIPSMMVSSSTDGFVKVWDISNNGGSDPIQIQSKDLKQELFTLQFCRDIPWLIASGGSNGEVNIWDMCENQIIENHFKKQIIPGSFSIDDYNPENPGNKIEDADSQENEILNENKNDKKKKIKKNKKDHDTMSDNDQIQSESTKQKMKKKDKKKEKNEK